MHIPHTYVLYTVPVQYTWSPFPTTSLQFDRPKISTELRHKCSVPKYDQLIINAEKLVSVRVSINAVLTLGIESLGVLL